MVNAHLDYRIRLPRGGYNAVLRAIHDTPSFNPVTLSMTTDMAALAYVFKGEDKKEVLRLYLD